MQILSCLLAACQCRTGNDGQLVRNVVRRVKGLEAILSPFSEVGVAFDADTVEAKR